jgi:hypothetical protein
MAALWGAALSWRNKIPLKSQRLISTPLYVPHTVYRQMFNIHDSTVVIITIYVSKLIRNTPTAGVVTGVEIVVVM